MPRHAKTSCLRKPFRSGPAGAVRAGRSPIQRRSNQVLPSTNVSCANSALLLAKSRKWRTLTGTIPGGMPCLVPPASTSSLAPAGEFSYPSAHTRLQVNGTGIINHQCPFHLYQIPWVMHGKFQSHPNLQLSLPQKAHSSSICYFTSQSSVKISTLSAIASCSPNRQHSNALIHNAIGCTVMELCAHRVSLPD